jgi:cytoskeleton protein RodZ
MTSTLAVCNVPPQPMKSPESLGHRLRAAREAKGMSEAQMATAMHLSVAMIQALENDQYDQLPGAVFVRGYLHNYARLVGIDDPVPPNDAGQQPHTSPPSTAHGQMRPEIRSNHFAVRLVSWGIVLALMVLLGLWWKGQFDWEDVALDAPPPRAPVLKKTRSVVTPPLPRPQPPPAAVAPVPVPPLVKPVMTTAPTNVVEQSAPPLPPPAPPTDMPKSAPPDAPPLPAAKSPGEEHQKLEVALEFVGACWVDVRDSSHKFKLFGKMRKAEKRVLEGSPPYTFVLGNSQMVRITVNGAPFNTEKYSRGGVARFNLDPKTLVQ